jgi:hypothetical protein
MNTVSGYVNDKFERSVFYKEQAYLEGGLWPEGWGQS